MKPADLKEKIQNADFRQKLKAYLEDIIKEDLDDFKDKSVPENPKGLNKSFHFPENMICISATGSHSTSPGLSREDINAALFTIDLGSSKKDTGVLNAVTPKPRRKQIGTSIQSEAGRV
jgi:hypothetical protein